MSEVTISQLLPNVLFFGFETQKELTRTMGRIQEFYESPHKNIRNHYFTFDDFIDAHMDDSGEIDYHCKWDGFNIPGHIVKNFFFMFRFDLSKRELMLKEAIEQNLDLSKPFYIIASRKDNDRAISHELAHALYYMSPKYQEKALELVLSLPQETRDGMGKVLLDLGYTEDVLNDEFQACLSTASANELRWLFSLSYNEFKSTIQALRKLFKRFNK